MKGHNELGELYGCYSPMYSAMLCDGAEANHCQI